MRYCMQKKLFIGPTLQQEIKIYLHKFGDSSAYIFIYIFPILSVILSKGEESENIHYLHYESSPQLSVFQ